MEINKKRFEVDFHQFKSDSEFYKQLNLSTFTTGTLFNWWDTTGNKTTTDQRYKIRNLIQEAYADQVIADPDWANANPHPFFPQDIAEKIQFEAWRFEDNNKGSYQTITGLENWEWSDPRSDVRSFSYSDLSLGSLSERLWSIQGTGLQNKRMSFSEDVAIDNNLRVLTQIIGCNDYVRLKEIVEPDTKNWSSIDLARKEFIDDIKTSRSGCISIPHSIYVNVTPDRSEPCPVQEDITINLYLRDHLKDASKRAFFALPALKKVGIRSDSTGRPYGSKVDGDLTSPDETNENQKVAADVDLQFNEYTQSWQSGSKTIIAKITKAVGRATGGDDLEALEAMDTTETLNSPDDNYLAMGTGEAMPITMQNGNPYQWTPNYAQPADCRAGNTDKAKVLVYNPDTEKSFPVGKMVMLHEVDGVWMPLEFGSGEDTTFTPESVFQGRWEIQQFATNAGNFFAYGVPQNSDAVYKPYLNVGQLNPVDAEKVFHRRYYKDDTFNNGSDNDPIKYAGNANAWEDVLERLVNERNGSYVRQITGFDYLEDKIGGTRGERRSINRTLFDVLPNNSTLDNTESPNNTVYFGAVFPDGYIGDNVGETTETGPQILAQTPRLHHIKAYASEGTFFPNTDLNDIVIDSVDQVLPTSIPEDNVRSAYRHNNLDSENKQIDLLYDYAANGVTDMKQLPADYATHCSPSGTYGRPITNMQNIVKTDNLVADALQQAFRKGFYTGLYAAKDSDQIGSSFYNWLHREPANGWGDDEYDHSLSAFDWRPLRPNRIQFRPLQAELFANDHGLDSATAIQALYTDEFRRDWIYNFLSTGVLKKNDDNDPVWSAQSRTRESADDSNFLYPEAFGSYTDMDGKPSKGLLHNNDYSASVISFYNPSNRVPKGVYRCATTAIKCNHNRVEPANNGGGIGGVGVIGSVCTVSASSRINFITANKIGMISWFLNKRWFPSWGGAVSDRYDKFGTTDLSVRVYQAHPREDTLYDSRFFAVYHFNQGSRLPFKKEPAVIHEKTLNLIPKEIYDLYQRSDDGTISTLNYRFEIVDTDGDGNIDCYVDVAETDVDVRVPSFVEFADDAAIKALYDAEIVEVKDYTRQPASITGVNAFDDGGDRIFKNEVYSENTQTTAWKRLLSKTHWNVEPNRRGKLLPYSSKKLTPQLPHIFFNSGATDRQGQIYAVSDQIDNYDQLGSDFPTLENGKKAREVDLVLVNLGQGYELGDRFKVEGFLDSDLKVSSIGVNGCITGLEFNLVVTGASIKPSEFKKYGTDLNPNVLLDAGIEFDDDGSPYDLSRVTENTRGGARLTPFNKLSVSGKGFSAYFTNAVVRNLTITDEKPKIASYQDFTQLSIPSDKRQGGSAGEDFLFGFFKSGNNFIDMSQGERIVNVDITPYSSPSGLYDCFLHFHNDISHTWLDNANIWGAHNSYDQYIQLEINPV